MDLVGKPLQQQRQPQQQQQQQPTVVKANNLDRRKINKVSFTPITYY